MEKVVLTTYRKLYKMCRRVDASVAMRTQLMCCPLQVYDHRLMEWRSFDMTQMDWAESRSYLDGLIRRLNNGSPQYIPPLPEEAARAVEEYRLQCARILAEKEKSKAAPVDGASAAAANAKGCAEPLSTPASGGSSTGGTRSSAVPLSVLPFSKFTVALRHIYEETPFSMNNVANGFAVVKELQYVCNLDDAVRANLITLSPDLVEGASPFSSTSDIPQLQRALEVAPRHNSVVSGLSAEQRVSLERQPRTLRRAARRKSAPSASMAAATAAAVAAAGRGPPGNAFDEAPDAEEEDMIGADEAEVDLSDKVEGDEPVEEESVVTLGSGAASQSTEAPAGEELGGSLPSTAELMDEPTQVQLLLSHPTARGFFRHTVLLVVRHVTHESAAFVLNKPLRNDEGAEMSIGATVRLGRVHPIYRQHLTQHPLMIGGPVMSGSSFDESIFLLHRVQGIPNALPLGSGLWMDGDLDALMAKLDAKEASAERDVVVLCGFAGWGVDQLRGELANGYWVVASGPSENPTIGSFVMSLAHMATGQQHQQLDGQREAGVAPSSTDASDPGATMSAATAGAASPTTAAAPSEAQKTSEQERIRAEAQRTADETTSRAIPALKHRRRRAETDKGKGVWIETLSWVRAYASLGKPYSDMAMNQKAYFKEDDFQE
ncbi:hypothetical protein ABL78_0731 [Leptomonas seymouri]|uniref:YqgE/AlgH family protein n=1 Tax=Leptomonas seymouri TaxID=5684 RepID=A0A0N1IMM6_LEPSE|nr:hypothetical protein ABL78_0731 [Leptomonas seymouri]|eukprot:KPI90213.1 hypothetical protein ABL78_0731 [Leptomonas seymouri]